MRSYLEWLYIAHQKNWMEVRPAGKDRTNFVVRGGRRHESELVCMWSIAFSVSSTVSFGSSTTFNTLNRLNSSPLSFVTSKATYIYQLICFILTTKDSYAPLLSILGQYLSTSLANHWMLFTHAQLSMFSRTPWNGLIWWEFAICACGAGFVVSITSLLHLVFHSLSTDLRTQTIPDT